MYFLLFIPFAFPPFFHICDFWVLCIFISVYIFSFYLICCVFCMCFVFLSASIAARFYISIFSPGTILVKKILNHTFKLILNLWLRNISDAFKKILNFIFCRRSHLKFISCFKIYLNHFLLSNLIWVTS